MRLPLPVLLGAGVASCLAMTAAVAPAPAAPAAPVTAPAATPAAVPALPPAARPSPFVRATGTGLVVEGRPFRFVGANLAVMHDEPWRSRYRDTIAAAATDGLTVGRVWALGEGAVDAERWENESRLFRAGPDGWFEQAFVHLDRVLAEARRRGLKLIVTLSNNWPDYGGLWQYLRWAGYDTDEYGVKIHFYTDAKIRAWYRAHLERLLTRRNTVTGVRYRDDPTIFAWELMNESTLSSPAAFAARRAWVVEMARFIRARDPNHMISPGLLGYDTLRERDEWIRIMQLPEVDYCDAHFYPQDNDYKLKGRAPIEKWVDDVAQLARFVVKKPLVIGEFGFRVSPASWEGQGRAAWFDTVVSRALDDGAAGSLVWIYEPWRGRERNHGIYVDGARSEAVRAVLKRHATRVAAGLPELRNPLLGPARGAQQILEQIVTVLTKRKPASSWQLDDDGALVLELQPTEFTEARWERLGSWDGGPLLHVYGSETGYFEYRFELPPNRAPKELRVRARLSSEFPGTTSPPDGVSRVRVLIDGVQVAAVVAFPDDGIGRWYELAVNDPALLGRLTKGAHALRFEVPEGAQANGVAIYGPNTGRGDTRVSDGGPLQLRLLAE
ncbi:MAG TPA: cellulase family glycosylhydrolase [Polyangia bacterium]|jgi:mannan endo-1,4-beta-mannosidase